MLVMGHTWLYSSHCWWPWASGCYFYLLKFVICILLQWRPLIVMIQSVDISIIVYERSFVCLNLFGRFGLIQTARPPIRPQLPALSAEPPCGVQHVLVSSKWVGGPTLVLLQGALWEETFMMSYCWMKFKDYPKWQTTHASYRNNLNGSK
jgi:hypothetical protein